MALRLRLNIPKTGCISHLRRNDSRSNFISWILILSSYHLIIWLSYHLVRAYVTNTYTNTYTNALTYTFTFTFRCVDPHTNIHIHVGTYTIMGIHPESTSHTHLWGWRYDGTSKHPGARNKICGAATRKEGLPIIFQGPLRQPGRNRPWKMIGSPSFLIAAPHILFLAPGCLLVPSYRHPHKCVWDVLSGWSPIIVRSPVVAVRPHSPQTPVLCSVRAGDILPHIRDHICCSYTHTWIWTTRVQD